MDLSLMSIFFQMAYELHSMLIDAVNMTTGEKVMPAYGGEPESFLNNIVFELYKVIQEVLNMQTWNYVDLF